MSSSPSNSTETPPSPPSPSSPPPPSPDSSSKSPPPPPSSPSPSPPPPPPSPSPSPPPPNSTSPPPPPNNKSPPPPPPWKSPPPPPPPPPPPTPYRYGSIPPPSPSSDDYSSPNEKTMMIGAAAGAGLILLLMIMLLASCGRRRKRKPHDHMKYYRDHSHGNQSNLNWSTGQPSDHAMRVPPALNSAQVSSELNWPIGPPPPPPMMTSSELRFSGPAGPNQPQQPISPSLTFGFNQSTFTYDDLAVATGGFAKSNLLGQGGFGYVHKGVLPNGKEVAVKSLKANSGQGEREFQAEVDIISRVHHRHLVSLVGYCIAGSQRMLVYEYMPNGSLEHHLYGADVPPMDWNARLKIALGSAKGFAYLHEDCHPRIIHRDIKASNILLDFNYEAKVSDFGLAKLSSDNYTHVSTRIMGTFGYMAPEYASSGKLTDKSDVYSYGVMLLELITGRRPIDVTSDDDGLVDWARPILVQVTEGGGSYEELVDPRLGNNYDPQEMLRMVVSAAACIRHSARRRPKMSQIVRALEGDASLDDLNDHNIRMTGNNSMSRSGSDYDNGSYSDLKNFTRAGTMSSQEFTSSEHGHTGELIH